MGYYKGCSIFGKVIESLLYKFSDILSKADVGRSDPLLHRDCKFCKTSYYHVQCSKPYRMQYPSGDSCKLYHDVENIVAIKEATGNVAQAAKTMYLTDGKLDLYSGEDGIVVPLMSIGAIGVISVWSNVAPKDVHDMCMAFFDGDTKKAMEIQLKAQPLIEALFSEVNPIPVKKALNLMGMEAGPLRSPLTEMTDANAAKLAEAMKNYGIKLA